VSRMVRFFDELSVAEMSLAGGKGSALARLYRSGFPVPNGFVILPIAFVDDELVPEAWAQIQTCLNLLREVEGRGDTPSPVAFAVRSSAMSEDSVQTSFAGEFETVLNVHTDEDVQTAIRTVYRSRMNARVQAYSRARGLGEEHEVAVVVQRLVHGESSGVLFTANPVTGRRDQAMISAAWGLGEAIVGGLVTPDTLIIDKTTGSVIRRETADKKVMTVRMGIGTAEQPVPEAMRRLPVLSDQEAADLMQMAIQIEELYRMPVDIEWVVPKRTGTAGAGTKFSIVQVRPITALPEAESPFPSDWRLPSGSYMAVRNNIVELMSEPLTPLFETLGLAAVNASLRRLLGEFFGKSDLVPHEMIISVNHYAYYGSAWTPGQIGRILLGSVGILKSMFTGAVERWFEAGRPRYAAVVESWQATDWRNRPATELLNAVRALSEATIDAYGALVSGVIPAAWISEGLFTIVYNLLIKRRDDPKAPVFLMGFDSTPIQAEKALYDLARWVRSRPELATCLEDVSASDLATQLETIASQPPEPADTDDWWGWRRHFLAHLQCYGHTIYNLDFANSVPADDPAPLLETFKMFVRGQGTDPHERQRVAVERRELATQTTVSRLKGLRLKLFRRFLASAQRYAPLRENGLADIGLSYPVLRQMLRELGRRCVEGRMLATCDDIFWLTEEEVEQAASRLDLGQPLLNLSSVISQRRAAWRAAKRVTPPMMLPEIRIFGRDLGQIKTARVSRRDSKTLKGVAASPGCVTGPACVLTGPESFSQMRMGDVLVAPLTTPAWTPLFARAAAIVTDVGGPLSHGSIVAREYGIPAVLGTGAATRRIQSGDIITVNGTEGKVYLTEEDGQG
jgi:phosphohistidine swiveling domain-containing protein